MARPEMAGGESDRFGSRGDGCLRSPVPQEVLSCLFCHLPSFFPPGGGEYSAPPGVVQVFVGAARAWPGYDYGWLADMVEASVDMGLRRGNSRVSDPSMWT